jgi:serine phosphatase RsbU (regulator of sigma subunit)
VGRTRTIIIATSPAHRDRGDRLAEGLASGAWGDGGPARIAIEARDWATVCEGLAGEGEREAPIDAIVLLAAGESTTEIEQVLEAAGMHGVPVVVVDDRHDEPLPAGCMRLGTSVEDACIAAATLGFLVRSDEVARLERELKLLERVADGVQAEITRVDEELQMACLVQQEFLPRIPPPVEGIEFAALWRPASSVSGDIYDIVRLDERRVGIFIADAVGHGVPAALMSMLLCRSLETKERYADRLGAVDRVLPPGEALARLNSAMVARQGRMGRYAAAIYAVVDCRERTMRIASAGGPPPVVLTRNNGVRILSMTGSLLGMHAQQEFDEAMIELAPDDRVLFHSDGFEQAFRDNAELAPANEFMPRYLEEFLRLRELLQPDDAIRQLGRRLDGEEGSLHPSDDCTLVLVHARSAISRLAA